MNFCTKSKIDFLTLQNYLITIFTPYKSARISTKKKQQQKNQAREREKEKNGTFLSQIKISGDQIKRLSPEKQI